MHNKRNSDQQSCLIYLRTATEAPTWRVASYSVPGAGLRTEDLQPISGQYYSVLLRLWTNQSSVLLRHGPIRAQYPGVHLEPGVPLPGGEAERVLALHHGLHLGGQHTSVQRHHRQPARLQPPEYFSAVSKYFSHDMDMDIVISSIRLQISYTYTYNKHYYTSLGDETNALMVLT